MSTCHVFIVDLMDIYFSFTVFAIKMLLWFPPPKHFIIKIFKCTAKFEEFCIAPIYLPLRSSKILPSIFSYWPCFVTSSCPSVHLLVKLILKTYFKLYLAQFLKRLSTENLQALSVSFVTQ